MADNFHERVRVAGLPKLCDVWQMRRHVQQLAIAAYEP
jgi:hypothetical protein